MKTILSIWNTLLTGFVFAFIVAFAVNGSAQTLEELFDEIVCDTGPCTPLEVNQNHCVSGPDAQMRLDLTYFFPANLPGPFPQGLHARVFVEDFNNQGTYLQLYDPQDPTASFEPEVTMEQVAMQENIVYQGNLVKAYKFNVPVYLHAPSTVSGSYSVTFEFRDINDLTTIYNTCVWNFTTCGSSQRTGSIEADRSSIIQDLYPNPVHDRLVLSYALITGSPVEVDLYTTMGQHIRQILFEPYQLPGEHFRRLNLNGLPAGRYMLRIHTNKMTENKVLIVK